ncbi:Fic family protein [Vandammella animalimorsus]|nr:Fic family protein [Vandammella animalimorsus]
MAEENMRKLGYAWLHQHLNLTAFDVPRPACVRPVTRLMPMPDLLAVPAHVAPAEGDMAAQLLFALKHEGVNLQILAQAMPHLGAQSLLAVLAATPNGRYARVLAHLWETLRGEPLPQRPPVSGAYVDVFDPRRYVTGPAQRDPRWRVNFNGLGTARYCATVERTPAIDQGMAADVLGRTAAFLDGLDAVLLDRALGWAYLHETEDSYAIEHEKPSEDKARAFVHLLKMAHQGRPFTEGYLAELQSSTVTNPFDKAVQFRTEQNWLRGPGRGAAGVSYVPPPPALLPELMDEWMRFANQAPRHVDPIVAASVAAFGFVFLHPFMDGNGRLSRFIFHQALCASGRLPKGQLLPVSVAMKRHEAQYLQTLQSYSRPARERVHVSWIDEGQYHFDFKADAAIFRYWDATACVEFGFQMAAQALDVELKQETAFLARFDEIARRVNARIDMRGNDLATLVTLCLDNGGTLSARKRKRYAHRVPAAAFDAIEAATRAVLATPAPPPRA